MIEKKSVLAVIPARGGSKGLPRKNIKTMAGKPLISWTIEAAQASAYIDRLVLSSEDEEIIEVAHSFGCEVPFVRPAELAEDESSGIDPILHALEQLPGYDVVVVLQPTSPLRTTTDIDECLRFFQAAHAQVCVSMTEADKKPHWMFFLSTDHHLQPVIKQDEIGARRQDLPEVYLPNGALFIASSEYLLRSKSFYTDQTIGYLMPKERSYEIDDLIDFKICEYLLNNSIDA